MKNRVMIRLKSEVGMANSSSNNNFVYFDGVQLDPKYRSLINALQRDGITTLEQLRRTPLYLYILEKWLNPGKDTIAFLREFRSLTDDSMSALSTDVKWDDALGKRIPLRTLNAFPWASVCEKYKIETLYDLISLPVNRFTDFFPVQNEIGKFVEILRGLPLGWLNISDTVINNLRRNGILTIETLLSTGFAYLSHLPEMNDSLMNEILDSLKNISEAAAQYGNYKLTLSAQNQPLISFDEIGNVLWVYKYAVHNKNHDVIPATGIVASLDGDPIKININYCINCKKCFIGLNDYEFYRKRYNGALLGNIFFDDDVIPKGKRGFGDLAPESKLRLCGYNVNKQDDLPEFYRHRILGSVMDHGIMKKPEIQNHLSFLIEMRKNNPSMQLAIEKWSDDLDWVREYNINRQRRYLIRDVKKN